jgi:hypothetical protein
LKKKRILLFALAVVLAGSILFLIFRPGGDDPNSVRVFPGANSRETYFTLHQIREAQSISRGKGCKVGILDHSFGMNLHSDLYAGGMNFVQGNDEFLYQREWHGYWMATVLHEIAPEAEIYALNTRTFKDRRSDAEAISKAVDWAIEHHLDVLTYSADGFEDEPGKILDAALDRAYKAGIVTTFIHTTHPKNILPDGLFSSDRKGGREADINVLQFDYTVVVLKQWEGAMPFFSISSTYPVAGGVVAMMKSLRPDLTPEQCQKILRETAHPMDFHGEKPPRVLDALAAVRLAKVLR